MNLDTVSHSELLGGGGKLKNSAHLHFQQSLVLFPSDEPVEIEIAVPNTEKKDDSNVDLQNYF